MFKSKSFQRNLFLSVGGLFIAFAICFSMYQYRREKEYKIDIMHSRLQMYNYEMMQTLGEDSLLNATAFNRYVRSHNVEGLRVTVIDTRGRVLLDTSEPETSTLQNHLQRPEIQQALQSGSGYDSRRLSASTHETYFYSATRFGNIILRAAVPYSTELTRSLQADNSYLYFAFALTVLLVIILYYNTSRIGRHIGYLRRFAIEAEQGHELDHELERNMPDDELGDISHTIITLYWQLRHSEEDKVRIKRQLTQNAAHELKTPAASIHGYLESILENPDMPADQRQHFLERCYAQSERMTKLLLDMSMLIKLDEQTPQPPLGGAGYNSRAGNHLPLKGDGRGAFIDVASVINNVLDDTALQLQTRGLVPSLNLPQHILINGDSNLIYSIFRNLVDNAIAYATGATRLSIVCAECEESCENEGGKGKNVNCYYEFSVSDNGQGVDPQHLPHLFERFYRVDKGRSRKLGGTGLGLAIVKNAVAAHGGTTTASLTPGGGLTITFTLMR